MSMNIFCTICESIGAVLMKPSVRGQLAGESSRLSQSESLGVHCFVSRKTMNQAANQKLLVLDPGCLPWKSASSVKQKWLQKLSVIRAVLSD